LFAHSGHDDLQLKSQTGRTAISRFVAFQLDVGGLIWVNPEHVSSVQKQGDGIALIRFAAGAPQQVAHVRGEPGDLVRLLCDPAATLDFDRRERAATSDPETVGLFGVGLAARMK
jgi:hypothetical protein